MNAILNVKLKIRLLLLLLLPVSYVTSLAAGPVSVKASLEPDVLMGVVTALKLEVVEDSGSHGEFPLLREIPKGGYLPICQDSVELRSEIKLDTVQLGSGRIQINYTVPVQAFNPGKFRLPEFMYVTSQGDTVKSEKVSLNVLPVEVGEDENIYDYADVAPAEDEKLTDKIPDSIYDNWIWILVVLILLAILIWLFVEFKRTGYFIKPKRQKTPYEIAVEQLRKLKKRKLWQAGKSKDYYTELTDILRRYLQQRFGINAMEMTSAEILEALDKHPETTGKGASLRDLLNTSDFVKFAKVQPEDETNEDSFKATAKFVETTKPVEPKGGEKK